jgi:uncharacterized membrane protein
MPTILGTLLKNTITLSSKLKREKRVIVFLSNVPRMVGIVIMIYLMYLKS